jgi:cobalt/nickel transport system ATP-binding protein
LGEPAIEARNLTVVYPYEKNGRVLVDLSFTVRQGERVALIGANGAGKSTLLLSMVGVLPVHDGAIKVCGVNVEKKNLGAVRKAAALVFQNPDDELFMPSVYEDIVFGPRNYAGKVGVDEALLSARVDTLLTGLGIEKLKSRMSHKLSGGEKRMVSLASVLIMEPQILLLDEPSAFLDPRARRRLITVLESLKQTLIIATHDLDLALKLCARTLLLYNGAISADGESAAILSDEVLLERNGL